MLAKYMRDFFKMELSTGVMLIISAISAMIVANSTEDIKNFYNFILNKKIPLDISLFFFDIYKELSVKEWINDGLMPLFFFLVGLELKRELISGELSTKSKIALPSFAAVFGVLIPAIIYANINYSSEVQIKGWAIPAATDIAFVVAIIGIFGKKIDDSLKIFIVTLAVIDDLIAILIIALFYSDNIGVFYLEISLLIILCLFILNNLKVVNFTPYFILGFFLWLFVLKSGVHATIAGVILSFFIPIKIKMKNRDISPLHFLEKKLHIVVGYIILPIFAFANSGISLSSFSIESISHKVVYGIILGLFLGKQLGVFISTFLLIKLKAAKFFKNTSWLEFYGVTILTGVGFTMSLFIGNLAFTTEDDLLNEVKVGVFLGSIISGIFGYIIIKIAHHKKDNKNFKKINNSE